MKNKLKRIVSMLLCAMLLCGLLPLAATAGDTGTVEQKAYVSAGLTAWFDGTNNSNGTHRIPADLWKDLSGNTNHIAVVRGVVDESLRWQADMAFIDPEKGYRMRLFKDLIDLFLPFGKEFARTAEKLILQQFTYPDQRKNGDCP